MDYSHIRLTSFFYVLQVKAVFITQNEQDHLLMNLTVEEAIYYSSNLKMNKSAENEKIEQLIEQLELTNCRSTLVKSCSGGQKKRIAIAQELVGSIKPRLLFLGMSLKVNSTDSSDYHFYRSNNLIYLLIIR